VIWEGGQMTNTCGGGRWSEMQSTYNCITHFEHSLNLLTWEERQTQITQETKKQ